MQRLTVPDAAPPETVLTRLGRLVRLEMELGLVETRQLLRRIVIAVAVAVPAAVAVIASLVVLIAGALAPVFGAGWQHLVVAGGGVLVLSLASIAWSVWRLWNLQWPRETLASFEENWRWLGAQLRSRLTLR